MIRYALRCTNDHGFESWFASASAFDTLAGSGMVACPECGSAKVEKSLMAPSVNSGRKPAGQKPAGDEAQADRPLSVASHPMEAALKALRKHIDTKSEYVGTRFAKEARAIHGGESPDRLIHGEARLDEVKQLLDDGVPITPLPFAPERKIN